ncbi:MAG: GNAT family N-acetyltransferase [Burkholderiales bacterium]|nr:GNAT family N-acetyltransferase [Burkholderiales bacterium]
MSTFIPPRKPADALWLLAARSRGGQHWVANAECHIETIDVAGHSVPVTVPDASPTPASYVLCPQSAWLRYARDEVLRHLRPPFSVLANVATAGLYAPLAGLMQASHLHQAAIIGNHLISTNLYPAWQASELQQMTTTLADEFPMRPLLMRNICPEVHPELAQGLREAGWQLVPARMIYLCDPQQPKVWKHNHVKQDARLLSNAEVEVISADMLRARDLPALRQLFRQLFIDKHSHLNPDFTPAFFELCLETGFLELTALRWQNRLVGVLGLYACPDSGWATTPLIGYDTSLPPALGLYRRLMALLLQQSRERQLRLHYSSGASQFKRARGGSASLEYTAIYHQHLSGIRRQGNRVFSGLFQHLAPGLLRRADQL